MAKKYHMEWLFIALIPPISWALASVFDKILVSKYVKEGIAAGILTNTFSGIVALLLLPFISLKSLSFSATLLFLCIGVIWGWNRLTYTKAMSMEEASRVLTIAQMSPVIILIGSTIFFGEILRPIDFIAFLLILIGVVWISLKKVAGKFHVTKAIWWMIPNVLLFALTTLMLKLTEISDWPIALFWINIGFVVGCLPLAFLPKYYSEIKRSISGKLLTIVGVLLSINLLTSLGRASYFVALQKAPAAIVSVLAGTQSIFVFFLAILLTFYFPKVLKEDHHVSTLLSKFLAIVLILIGIILLYLA